MPAIKLYVSLLLNSEYGILNANTKFTWQTSDQPTSLIHTRDFCSNKQKDLRDSQEIMFFFCKGVGLLLYCFAFLQYTG